MNNSRNTVIAIFILMLGTLGLHAKQNDDINIFPTAKEGFEQVVIQLDTLLNEEQYMIEFFAGKSVAVDACNQFGLMGNWEQADVQGWGYPYYEFQSNGEVISTLIGCLDSERKEKVIYGKGNLIRYNSKIPIVVYVPKGMSIQYRIWNTNNEMKQS